MPSKHRHPNFGSCNLVFPPDRRNSKRNIRESVRDVDRFNEQSDDEGSEIELTPLDSSSGDRLIAIGRWIKGQIEMIQSNVTRTPSLGPQSRQKFATVIDNISDMQQKHVPAVTPSAFFWAEILRRSSIKLHGELTAGIRTR